MSKLVLAVNAGSSSLKFQLFEVPSEKVVTNGLFDRVGRKDGIFKLTVNGVRIEKTMPLENHEVCVDILAKELISNKVIEKLSDITAIGHRVVQGGKHFADSVVFDEKVAAQVEKLIPLAPLHNGPNLDGYLAFKKVLPKVPSVAVFDTSFHQTMAPQDYLFPIPYEYYEKHDFRRYGFHGTSHKYITEEIASIYGSNKRKIIICHLGNGASITAVKDGKSIATSMGLTPLGGIMMGTRTGDLDPSIMYFIAKRENKTIDEVYDILNKESGMLGVSQISNDSREVEAAAVKGDKQALFTEQLYARRISDFIGQYHIRLGGADTIAFTAGIGENVSMIRKLVLEEIKDAMGITYDNAINKVTFGGKQNKITTDDSKVDVWVIPTNEELMIVRDTVRVLNLCEEQNA